MGGGTACWMTSCALEVFSLWLKKSSYHYLGKLVSEVIDITDSLKSFGVATDELKHFISTLKEAVAKGKITYASLPFHW